METYDPILKESFPFQRRIIGPLHSTPLGTAYVLFGHDGKSIVLKQGHSLRRRDSIVGRYTEGFVVDVRQKRMEKTVDLPCHGDAHHFAASFQMTCWVKDALAVVRETIHDAGAVLWSAVIRDARELSRQYSLDKTAGAEKAITNRLADPDVELHPAFGTQLVAVSLSPDPQAVELLRRNTNVLYWNGFSENQVVAAYLAEHPGDIRGGQAVFDEQLRQHREVVSLNGAGTWARKELRERHEHQMGVRGRDDPAEGVLPVLPPQELPVNFDRDEEGERGHDLARILEQ